MISFKNYILLTEAFGKVEFDTFKKSFSNLNPTFRQDGRTISFITNELNKDGLITHLNNFFNKSAYRIKKDLGDVAAYKLKDDNIAVIQQPKKIGSKYEIDIKFSY